MKSLARLLLVLSAASYPFCPNAHADNFRAFAWVDCLDSSCTPNTLYQYTSEGGVISAVRTGTGRYTVTIPRSLDPFDLGGVTHATAYGSDAYATVVSEVYGPFEIYISVEIQRHGSVLVGEFFQPDYVDGRFSLYHYQSDLLNPPQGPGAYLQVEPTAASGAGAIPGNQWNSSGSSNSFVQDAVGSYVVTFPGLNDPRTHPLVTSFGTTGAKFRVVDVSRQFGAAPSTTVRLRCTDSDGDATSAGFACSLIGAPQPGEVFDSQVGAHASVSFLEVPPPPFLRLPSLAQPGPSFLPSGFQFPSFGPFLPQLPGIPSLPIGSGSLLPGITVSLFQPVNGNTIDENNGASVKRLQPGVYDVTFDEIVAFDESAALVSPRTPAAAASIDNWLPIDPLDPFAGVRIRVRTFSDLGDPVDAGFDVFYASTEVPLE